jgi:uncharacterized repeat protein (TIGR03803 family)
MKHSRTILLVTLSLLLVSVSAFAVDKFKALYRLSAFKGDGYGPTGDLLMDAAGNLYGGTASGTVFQLAPNGSGGYNYNVISTCCAYGLGGFVMDAAGNLYGTTYFGLAFELSPTTSGPWTYTEVYSFDGTIASALTIDASGNLYGAAASGGAYGDGYIFELSNSSGSWVLTDLFDFNGTDGAEGFGASGLAPGVIMDSQGDLYGATFGGGTSGDGVVFKLHNNSGTWTETVLHDFVGSDGANPVAKLVMDASGNLYGTASEGGAHGSGTVFETTLIGSTWVTYDLYDFAGYPSDGAYPSSPLVVDASGNLYGATAAGGPSDECEVETSDGCGTAFELQVRSGHGKETILHNFLSEADGGVPGGLIADSSGNLYGATMFGGPPLGGLIFELTPP